MLYHGHRYQFLPYEKGTLLDYILENAKHSALQMDFFWMKQGRMEPTKILQKYPGRLLSLHVKDCKKGTQNTTKGTGDVSVASVIAEAKKQGIHYYSIGVKPSSIMFQVPENVIYLKRLYEMMHA
jgi:sugar phosphate isomerase/epimerase